ncbi:MAG TPA: CaiB/BaiF CoA-transferase family protein [Bacteroidia bacterium]|nr:CaiB/BaiF CoA-transferase family protein [Bacteroidia bacterium]
MNSFSNHYFKGLKVVELASVLAGPSAGLFFAELGAEVIKIENKKTGGDVTRSWKLPTEDKKSDVSAYFLAVNFLKKHLFLDVSNDADYKKCIAQIKYADIVIANYKKGDDKKLKLDYATLKKINPTLIYAGIQGFSDTDERVAYDLILQAESGFMSMNGTKDSGPLKMPVAMIDILAAHHLKEAILLALLKKQKTKKGSYVSVSLFDVAVASLANQATNWLVAKHIPQPTGSLHPNIAPYGETFITKDNHTDTFAIGSDGQFAKLCELLHIVDVSSNKNYVSNQLRVINRKKIFTILNKEVKKQSLTYLQKECTKHGVPFAKIRNLKEVFELPEAKKLIKNISYNKKKYSVVTSFPAKNT